MVIFSSKCQHLNKMFANTEFQFVSCTFNLNVRRPGLSVGVTVLIMPDRAVAPMMLAIRLSKGESSVLVCPPPVADVSRLWAATLFLALTLTSNHFFLQRTLSEDIKHFETCLIPSFFFISQ